jgi:hypothetical protein
VVTAEPLSPELALVDPDLAERARANLVDAGEAASLPAPAREIAQTPPPLRPSSMPKNTPAAIEATRRRPSIGGSAVMAVVVLAVGIGVTAAVWAHHDDSAPSAGAPDQPSRQPPRDESSTTATSERGKTTTARASKQALVGQQRVRAATRSRQNGTHVAGRPSGIRSQAFKPPRPAAFHAAGAPKEPLDEITLPARARRLGVWLASAGGFTAANQRHWLYQHAWIVTGAKFGWWHGAEALRVLIRVDRRVESRWGIGYRSEALARGALAAVEASASKAGGN